MTTYADLLYEAAELLTQKSRVFQAENFWVDAEELESQAERIREALRTRSAYPAMSTEDVERIKKHYDPSGSCFQDIDALSNSHEAIRRERDTAESIAERFNMRWIPAMKVDQSGDPQWWNQQIGRNDLDEPMTNDQIDWFERHNK